MKYLIDYNIMSLAKKNFKFFPIPQKKNRFQKIFIDSYVKCII